MNLLLRLALFILLFSIILIQKNIYFLILILLLFSFIFYRNITKLRRYILFYLLIYVYLIFSNNFGKIILNIGLKITDVGFYNANLILIKLTILTLLSVRFIKKEEILKLKLPFNLNNIIFFTLNFIPIIERVIKKVLKNNKKNSIKDKLRLIILESFKECKQST